MKKHAAISLFLVLCLALGMTVPALAQSGVGGEVHAYAPVYIGDAETDYLADLVLAEIPTAGKTDREKIEAVYTWIQKNCSREETGKLYYDEASVRGALPAYTDAVNAAIRAGQASVRVDYRAQEMPAVHGWTLVPHDCNSAISAFALSMLYTRGGNCMHFSSLLCVLLSHLGFDCRVIDGDWKNRDGTTYEHKWNCVLIDGQYYWLDSRMDHNNYARTGTVSFTYFLESSTGSWETNHIWDHTYSDWLFANSGTIAKETMHGGPWSKCSAWAEPYLKQALEGKLIPDALYGRDMTSPISREEFAAVAVALYEALSGSAAPKAGASPFADCHTAAVVQAYSLGIVYGVDSTHFAPSQTLTREQAAAMMGRVYELSAFGAVGDGSALMPQDLGFSDASKISAYAKGYIGFYAANGILSGMGDGSFAPAGTMTREQALKVAAACLSNLK